MENSNQQYSQVKMWWYPSNPELRQTQDVRQGDLTLKASMSYIARSCLKMRVQSCPSEKTLESEQEFVGFILILFLMNVWLWLSSQSFLASVSSSVKEDSMSFPGFWCCVNLGESTTEPALSHLCLLFLPLSLASPTLSSVNPTTGLIQSVTLLGDSTVKRRHSNKCPGTRSQEPTQPARKS